MRARRGDEVSAAFDEFHSQNVDIFIASVCVLDFACALAECGRIENNEIEFFALVFVCAQNFEHVAALCRDIGYAVEARVFFDV